MREENTGHQSRNMEASGIDGFIRIPLFASICEIKKIRKLIGFYKIKFGIRIPIDLLNSVM